MKVLKLFSVLALSAMTLMAVAAPTRGFKMTISDNQTTDQGIDELALYEKADYTDITTNSSSEPGVKEQDYNILFYAVVGSAKYSTVWFNDIDGIKLTFESNSLTSYKITFSNVFGTVKLYDAVEDSVINVVAAGTYEFTCAANSTISDRFQVGKPATTYVRDNLTVGQYGTICYPGAVSKIEGGEVYELTSATATEVRGEQVTTTEAGKSYVFKATATSLVLTYDPATEIANPATTLGMVGNFGPAEISVPAGMFGINGTSVMEVAAGTKLKANRAYINLAELQAVPGAPGRKLFDVVGEVTALDAVKAEAGKVQKVMINGQMVIIRDGKMFNAQGAAL